MPGKTSRKKTSRKKISRKKTSRKKTSRKKTPSKTMGGSWGYNCKNRKEWYDAKSKSHYTKKLIGELLQLSNGTSGKKFKSELSQFNNTNEEGVEKVHEIINNVITKKTSEHIRTIPDKIAIIIIKNFIKNDKYYKLYIISRIRNALNNIIKGEYNKKCKKESTGGIFGIFGI